MKSKIMARAWIIAALLVATSGFLQNVCAAEIGDQLAAEFKNNIVQLTVKLGEGDQQNGFGFIVAENSGRLYVVTAGHVVRSDDPDVIVESVTAQFYSAQGKFFEATLLNLFESNLDLAVLEVQKPSPEFKWNPRMESPKVSRGDKVWFIGRNREWYVPTDEGGAGAISHLEPFERELIAEIYSVRPGTSGAPLFSESGIVGMVIQDESDEVVAIKIEAIKHYVSEKWKQPWNLEPRKPSTEDPGIPKPVAPDQTDSRSQLLAGLKREQEKIPLLFRVRKIDEGYRAIEANLKALRDALKKYPQDAEFLSLMGYAYKDYYIFSKGRDSADQRRKYLKTSVSYFSRAVKIDPKLAEAFNGMGYALYYQSQYNEAIKAYQTALKLTDGNYPDAERGLRRASQAKDRTPKTTNKQDRIVAALKREQDYLEKLIDSRKIEGLEEALKKHMAALGKALKTYPNDPEILTLMGWTYVKAFYTATRKVSADEKQAHLRRAYGYFARAIKSGFQNADTYTGLGFALFYQKKYDESIRAFTTALKLTDGKYPEAERGLQMAKRYARNKTK